MEHFTLCEKKIGNCAGDFFCWIRTPGVCNVDDDNRVIAAAIIASDLMVYLTPVTFGGYASTLKRMVDHQMQNVSAFFARVAGETHHAKRYKKNPDFLVVGWLDEPNAHSEIVFRHLVQRNALNWHSKTYVSGVVLANQSDEEMQASAQKWLDDLQNRRSSQRVELPINEETINGSVEMRRALLLVGSPKTRKSTSNSLGGYLFEQLSARSIQTETIYLHTVLRSPQKMQALFDAVDAADLVTLAFPLYVDSLPAPVIEALERMASKGKPLFVATGASDIGEMQDDAVIAVELTDGTAEILIGTRDGMAIRFPESDVRPMGRSAYGVRGISTGNIAATATSASPFNVASAPLPCKLTCNS